MNKKIDKELIKYKGKTYFKRLLILGLCAATCAPLFGCSKLEKNNLGLDDEDVETAGASVSESTEKLEDMNVANDTEAFITLDNQLYSDMEEIENTEDLSDEEKTSKKNLAIYDYVLNIVQLTSSRLSSDIETVYTHSEGYMSYLALLQTFADSYTDEKENVQDIIVNGKDASGLNTYKALKSLENYYIDVYNNINSHVESSGTTSSNSKTSSNTSNSSGASSNSSSSSDGTVDIVSNNN